MLLTELDQVWTRELRDTGAYYPPADVGDGPARGGDRPRRRSDGLLQPRRGIN